MIGCSVTGREAATPGSESTQTISDGYRADYEVLLRVTKSHTTGCLLAKRANVGTNSATAGWRRP